MSRYLEVLSIFSDIFPSTTVVLYSAIWWQDLKSLYQIHTYIKLFNDKSYYTKSFKFPIFLICCILRHSRYIFFCSYYTVNSTLHENSRQGNFKNSLYDYHQTYNVCFTLKIKFIFTFVISMYLSIQELELVFIIFHILYLLLAYLNSHWTVFHF